MIDWETINAATYTCWSCGAVSTPHHRFMFVCQTECWACATGQPVSQEYNAQLLQNYGRPFVAFEHAPEEELH